MPQSHPRRLPRWLKRNVPSGSAGRSTSRLVQELNLRTVCDHARCPNRMECYAQKTATFMILGDVCTRGCAFCSVAKGRPGPVDRDEPQRVARAVRQLGLRHAVITAVTRDDLPHGGAELFCRTIAEIRRICSATIEVLPSDFGGSPAAVDRLIEAAPEVYNHNTETVPRLYKTVRGRKADYGWTLAILRRVKQKNPAIRTKTGLMLGLGESYQELFDVLADLLDAGCRMLTLGQYLQPTSAQLPVVRYLPPEEFDRLGSFARRMGFENVASGPFVRSSYQAGRMLHQA